MGDVLKFHRLRGRGDIFEYRQGAIDGLDRDAFVVALAHLDLFGLVVLLATFIEDDLRLARCDVGRFDAAKHGGLAE